MKELPQQYDHKEAERRWQAYWQEQKTYAWRDDKPRAQTFVIDTPPPTVSGVLHMGHIFSYTQADFVARYQRMNGKDVFYPMGFDDNGLPTERLVEKTIKKRASDMSREAFITECEKVAEEARKEFRRLFESVALSVDWAQEYHTISDESRRISQLSFLDLYRKGHAYRKLQPMLWDPVDQTAIAQAEVVDREMESSMNYIRFNIFGNEDRDSLSLRERARVRAPKELVANARTLRRNSTNAENLLWLVLRDHQLEGYKFRRQHPIEPYVADFACVEAKLIVELDGGQHNEDAAIKRDEARTQFLEEKGYKVLRFWNNNVLDNLEGVVEGLLEALQERSPHPSPLPEGGGTVPGEEGIVIATTRPELIPACVAVFYHPQDDRYRHLEGKTAITPLFCVKVPILADEDVQMEKGTGLVMCCTFGDEQDIRWWKKHNLPMRIVLNKYGKLELENKKSNSTSPHNDLVHFPHMTSGNAENIAKELMQPFLNNANCTDIEKACMRLEQLRGKKTSNKDPKHLGARETILELLKNENLLVKQESIKHAVKCAERSGAPLEILLTHQWFVQILDKKEELKKRSNACHWYPDYMRLRCEQWIDGLNWDWCISRQRYFGVPFPIWYVREVDGQVLNGIPLGFSPDSFSRGNIQTIVAGIDSLPVNPLSDKPTHIRHHFDWGSGFIGQAQKDIYDNSGNLLFSSGVALFVIPEADVMDTWATSSVSPQLSSKGIASSPLEGEQANAVSRGGASSHAHRIPPHASEATKVASSAAPPPGGSNPYLLDPERHAKLFPADLRPQAHEIIRTWAFYTIVKAHLHENTIPWHNLMISGWCLAPDKTKMSKSKGNVITPVDLIEEKGADAVRYWASTSRLGADTAFSEDVLKIGKKLVTKLWNAAKFANQLPVTSYQLPEKTQLATLDRWVLSRLHRTIEKATAEFERFEYCDARAAIEDFFWNDFCDNYLEMVKGRAYGEGLGARDKGLAKNPAPSPQPLASQLSAILTIHCCLEAVLRLFAPFTPHITEELHSHIFAEEHQKLGSIHARGAWPKAADYPVDEAAEQAGLAARQILNVVRRMKAEKNVSLKWPLEELVIAPTAKNAADISSCLDDLKNVTNTRAITLTHSLPKESRASEDGAWGISATFAATSDAA